MCTVIAALACGSGGAWPIDSLELADLAGRVEHGYYAGDERVLEGALEDIGRDAGSGLVAYYEALASYRLAQLRAARGFEDISRLLERCRARSETLAGDDEYAAESWILVAACAQLASRHEPLKLPPHARRAEQALARARGLDPHNPRLALVEAQGWLDRQDTQRAREAVMRLEHAAEMFAARPYEGPEWGEAETLTLLSELSLAARDLRQARDLVERALLREPDYALAQAVRERVISAH
jgi:hypothetical protein